MKTTTLTLLLLISSTLIAGPQGRGMDLDLTETQKQQMAEVKERTHERRAEAMEEIHAQARAEMAEFLSVEQLAIVDEHMAMRKERSELKKDQKQRKYKMRRQNRD